MATINDVTIMGRLTRDPEADSTANDTAVCRLRIALDGAGPKDGEKYGAGFFNVVSYGAGAADAASRLKKGDLVSVSGQLRWHEWKDGEGKGREAVEIVGPINYVQLGKSESSDEQAEG